MISHDNGIYPIYIPFNITIRYHFTSLYTTVSHYRSLFVIPFVIVYTIIWLVVWNIFYFSIYWECHHPN